MVSFTLNKLKIAIFSCDGNKFSGAVGFSMAFFLDNWNLEGDLEKVFTEFF